MMGVWGWVVECCLVCVGFCFFFLMGKGGLGGVIVFGLEGCVFFFFAVYGKLFLIYVVARRWGGSLVCCS